jgi:DNA-binding transcriptional MerR regulator
MTYTIAQISEKFGVAASTLRYYEDLGLLRNVERAESGHRIYSEDHIRKLEAINCFKKAGMSINEIKDFFEYEKDEAKSIDDMMSLLKRRSEIMLEEFAEAYESYEHILKKLDYYGHIEKAIRQGKELPKWAKFDKKDYHKKALDTILDRIS